MHHTHKHTRTPQKTKNLSDSKNASLNPHAGITANTPQQRWQKIRSKFSYSKSQWPHYTSWIPLYINSTAVVLTTFYSKHTGTGGVQHTSSTSRDVRHLTMGIRYVKGVVRWFVVMRTYTYTNLDSIAYYTSKLSAPRLQPSTACFYTGYCTQL